MTHSNILLLKRASGAALCISIACAIVSTFVIGTHLLEWILHGTITHVTLGHVMKAEARWLYTPICFAGPILSFIALYSFFGIWSFAVRKDIEAEGAI